jgi:hypothetical protein
LGVWQKVKLNLGCGASRLEGWVNVDREAILNPDQVWDLDQTPWPWADSSVDEIYLIHVLEHLGERSSTFLAIIKELWRICQHDAKITIEVPHPRHDSFSADPTHVRPILPSMLALFDQALNRGWLSQNLSNTPLGLILGVDFRVESYTNLLAEPWRSRVVSGEVTPAMIEEAYNRYNNVVETVTVVWRAVKPGRG